MHIRPAILRDGCFSAAATTSGASATVAPDFVDSSAMFTWMNTFSGSAGSRRVPRASAIFGSSRAWKYDATFATMPALLPLPGTDLVPFHPEVGPRLDPVPRMAWG